MLPREHRQGMPNVLAERLESVHDIDECPVGSKTVFTVFGEVFKSWAKLIRSFKRKPVLFAQRAVKGVPGDRHATVSATNPPIITLCSHQCGVLEQARLITIA